MERVKKLSCPGFILGSEVIKHGDNDVDKENTDHNRPAVDDVGAVDNHVVAPPSAVLLQKNLRRSRSEYYQNSANTKHTHALPDNFIKVIN